MRSAVLISIIMICLVSPLHAEMYKWVDEKGNIHFTDDLLKIPEKNRSDAESRKTPKEVLTPKGEVKEPPVTAAPKPSEPAGFEVPLNRRGEVSVVTVVLNGRVKQEFILDTGASFTTISLEAAKELGITIDDSTPWIPITTASDVIFTPLVTLRSVRLGKAEVENVDALVHNLPGGTPGLLGNTFLNRFRVVLDSGAGKLTLFSLEGKHSPERPGGYGKDFWTGRFRFYHRTLEHLNKMKATYDRKDSGSDGARIRNAIRYFENQLAELERKASFAGVPRNWRQ